MGSPARSAAGIITCATDRGHDRQKYDAKMNHAFHVGFHTFGRPGYRALIVNFFVLADVSPSLLRGSTDLIRSLLAFLFHFLQTTYALHWYGRSA